MTGSTLLMIAALGQVAISDPDYLISQLGAPRYVEREGASSALERLGGRALPALRAAKDYRDPEVRTRAVSLINRIEGSLLTQATLVTFDFDDVPLRDALKSFGEQAGVNLTLVPEQSAQWAARRVTLRTTEPLPFWKALDRFCEVAQLQYNMGMLGGMQGRQPTFALFEGTQKPSVPSADSGPFRINIMALHFQRDVTFPAIPPRPPQGFPAGGPPPASPGQSFRHAMNENFYAQLQVMGEPRLSVTQNGALKILEAVDEKGQSLVRDTNKGQIVQRSAAYYGMNSGPLVQVQAPMIRPSSPGKVIHKLRAVLPLKVATRKPNPLMIKLATAAGQTFRNDDVAVTVHEVRPIANTRQTQIDMSVRALSGANAEGGSGDVFMQRPDVFQQQIDISDSRGKALTWFQTNFDAQSARMTLTVTPQALEGNVSPAELRIYGMARAATDVTFEFNDLPLP